MMRVAALATIVAVSASCEQSTLDNDDFAYLRETFPDSDAYNLALAAANGSVSRIQQLVSEGVPVDPLSEFSSTPLMVAIEFGRPESVAALLELGADPNHTSRSMFRSPLRMAMSAEDPSVLRMLLEHGGDPDRGKDRRDPLIIRAASRQNFLEVLVTAGADVNARGLNYDTALITAARRQRYQIVLYLLQNGADFTLVNRADESLIGYIEDDFYVNANSDVDYRELVVEFLRSEGAEVDPWEVPPE